MLDQLPPPPPGRSGWPWDEESNSLPPFQDNGEPWPRISIITPSLNQGNYIEETIRSIILQNYPELEFIIIDGGSNDNTLEVIRKYEKWISWWISEPDNGQSQAINKGLKRCSGILVNWICSDDLLCENALYFLAPIAAKDCNALFIGRGIRIDQNGHFINEIEASSIDNLQKLVRIRKYWRKNNSIMQQSCIFPLSQIKKIDYLNEKNHLTMDYELWGKLYINDIPVIRCNFRIGIFRWYSGQKTSKFNSVTQSLIRSAISLIIMQKKFSIFKRAALISDVLVYWITYYYHFVRSLIGIKRRLKKLLNVSAGDLYK